MSKEFHERAQNLNPASVPFRVLIRGVLIKIAWRLGIKKRPTEIRRPVERFVWQTTTVSDAEGPEGNVRNYHERRTLRYFLNKISKDNKLNRAAEVGCGYGRLTMVLTEYSGHTIGFEREPHLLEIARNLNPDIEFRIMPDLKKLRQIAPENFDFVYTCTILQHVQDEECRVALEHIKQMCLNGFILLIEKTESISVTENQADGTQFLSRARTIDTYSEYMKPFELVEVRPRVLEPTYFNDKPGTCMLFKSPQVKYNG